MKVREITPEPPVTVPLGDLAPGDVFRFNASSPFYMRGGDALGSARYYALHDGELYGTSARMCPVIPVNGEFVVQP